MPTSLESALRVAKEWNGCHGAFYRVEESDLRWNLERQSWLDYRVAAVAGVQVLLASASTEGIKAGIPSKTLWLSLHGPVPAGKEQEFVQGLVRAAREAGKARLQIGGEEFHFVAGVPSDEGEGARLAAAFSAEGFNAADAADFGGRLNDPRMTAYISESEGLAEKAACRLDRAESAGDSLELGEFLLKEFPGRWEREFRFWKTAPDTSRAFWNLLRDSRGKLLGFSRLALRGRIPDLGSGWSPGALKLPLDDKSPARAYADSCLGPIGISATERGRGAGKILLGLSLRELSLNKADRVCIDWTNAYNYYIPLGVRYLRKFHSTWKEI